MYNAYMPGWEAYETIPEDTPPGSDGLFSFLKGGGNSLSGLLEKLGIGRLDTGDLLLLLILYLLLKEDDQMDPLLLLALGAAFLLDD